APGPRCVPPDAMTRFVRGSLAPTASPRRRLRLLPLVVAFTLAAAWAGAARADLQPMPVQVDARPVQLQVEAPVPAADVQIAVAASTEAPAAAVEATVAAASVDA